MYSSRLAETPECWSQLDEEFQLDATFADNFWIIFADKSCKFADNSINKTKIIKKIESN